MNDINEYIVRFSGKASVDKPLELDKDYRVQSTVTCRKVSTTPNDDGTVDVTYTIEPITSEITSELGETYKVKKKSKQSVAMRFQIISLMRDLMPETENDEELYETAMGWIMQDLPNIITWLKKKYE